MLHSPRRSASPLPSNSPRHHRAGCKALKATNEDEQKAWQTLQHVRRIVIVQAAEAIESVYYAELEDPIEGLNDILI